jgi:hypothetical protein
MSRWVRLPFRQLGRDTSEVAVEEWRYVGTPGNPAFQNSWVNFNESTHEHAAFFKDPFGIVHLKGIIKNGSAINTVAFTLPVGYRPPLLFHCGAYSNSAFGGLHIQDSGNVIPQTGSTAWFSIDSATFRPAT